MGEKFDLRVSTILKVGLKSEGLIAKETKGLI